MRVLFRAAAFSASVALFLHVPAKAVDSGVIVRGDAGQVMQVHPNQVLEWTLHSTAEHDEPSSVRLDAILVDSHENIRKLPGFWAGGNEWRFRFSAHESAKYTFHTDCSEKADNGLHGHTGNIEVVDERLEQPLLRHGPIHLSGNGRHFVHADSSPFFWLADSWWHGMTSRLDWSGFKTIAADRKRKGFSVIQFAIAFPCDIEPFDPRGANEAGHAWTNGFVSINPAYFDRTDERLEHLVEQGFVPNVVGMWGYYLPFMGIEKVKQHWRYLVARYGAFPVTWTVCGESTLVWYLLDTESEQEARVTQVQGWSEVAQYIKRVDPFSRLRTVHPGPSSGRFQALTDMGSMDVIMLQPGHHDRSVPTAIMHRNEAEERFPEQPIMIGEACFEGMNGECKEKVQRMLFWGSVLSGAPGHSYGADAIWQFNSRKQLFGTSPSGHIWGNAPWEDASRWPGSTHVGVGKEILERFDWHHLLPTPQSVSPAADAENSRDAFAASIEDRVHLLYLPDGVAPWNRKYLMKGLNQAQPYVATFVDPITGETYPEIDVIASDDGTWRLPAAPILQDWVLVIRRTAQ